MPKKAPAMGSDEIGVDWLSATFPDEAYDGLLAWLFEREGRPVDVEHGRHGFNRAVRFGSGLTLSDGHASGRCMVNLPGSACAVYGSDVVVELCGLLISLAGDGVTFTRVDVRRDLVKPDNRLVGTLIQACEHGGLRRVRGFKSFVERDADTLELTGHGVYLGSSKSPRFVRCYDKGLESSLLPAGQWVRFEGQFREEFADAAVRQLVSCASSWIVPAFNLLVGVVDFVLGPRGSGAQWKRFPRMEFWSEFIGDAEPMRTSPARSAPSVDAYAAFLARALGQLSLAADASGLTLGQAVDALLGSADRPKKNRLGPELSTAIADAVGLLSSRYGEEEAIQEVVGAGCSASECHQELRRSPHQAAAAVDRGTERRGVAVRSVPRGSDPASPGWRSRVVQGSRRESRDQGTAVVPAVHG
jgi:hypothetical protein